MEKCICDVIMCTILRHLGTIHITHTAGVLYLEVKLYTRQELVHAQQNMLLKDWHIHHRSRLGVSSSHGWQLKIFSSSQLLLLSIREGKGQTGWQATVPISWDFEDTYIYSPSGMLWRLWWPTAYPVEVVNSRRRRVPLETLRRMHLI